MRRREPVLFVVGGGAGAESCDAHAPGTPPRCGPKARGECVPPHGGNARVRRDADCGHAECACPRGSFGGGVEGWGEVVGGGDRTTVGPKGAVRPSWPIVIPTPHLVRRLVCEAEAEQSFCVAQFSKLWSRAEVEGPPEPGGAWMQTRRAVVRKGWGGSSGGWGPPSCVGVVHLGGGVRRVCRRNRTRKLRAPADGGASIACAWSATRLRQACASAHARRDRRPASVINWGRDAPS